MEINHGVFVIPTQYIIETRNDGQESSHLSLTVDQCHKKCLDKQQEDNGPLDLRAKVMISNKKYGLTLAFYASQLCISIHESSFLKPTTTSKHEFQLNLGFVA